MKKLWINSNLDAPSKAHKCHVLNCFTWTFVNGSYNICNCQPNDSLLRVLSTKSVKICTPCQVLAKTTNTFDLSHNFMRMLLIIIYPWMITFNPVNISIWRLILILIVILLFWRYTRKKNPRTYILTCMYIHRYYIHMHVRTHARTCVDSIQEKNNYSCFYIWMPARYNYHAFVYRLSLFWFGFSCAHIFNSILIV